jgi:hypothetical protein
MQSTSVADDLRLLYFKTGCCVDWEAFPLTNQKKKADSSLIGDCFYLYLLRGKEL